MNHIDFTLILSSALTPITLISGVGLLLLTMSARYDHTTARVRQLLHADEMTGGTDPHLAEACLLYTSPSPRDRTRSRMPSSA